MPVVFISITDPPLHSKYVPNLSELMEISPLKQKLREMHNERNYQITIFKMFMYKGEKSKKYALNQLIAHHTQIQHAIIKRVKKPDIYSKKN